MFLRTIILIAIFITSSFAFKFDIWSSGLELQEAIEIAHENNIPLIKSSQNVVMGNRFNWKNLKNYKNYREFKYNSSLFGKKAWVYLYFTQDTSRLYKVRIHWTAYSHDKDDFEGTIFALLDKKYGNKEIVMPSNIGEYVFKKMRRWLPDKNTEIMTECSTVGIVLMYRDKMIEQEHIVSKKKKKLQIIMTDAPKL